MKGLFIPEITAEMFKSGCLESIEQLMAEGEIYDIEYQNIVLKEDRDKEPKLAHWIKISPAGIYECSECRQNVMTSDICTYKYCHGCGAKMESEVEDGDRDRGAQ